jgi:hypothetical protein
MAYYGDVATNTAGKTFEVYNPHKVKGQFSTEPLVMGASFMFFTAPSLNLTGANISKIPFFKYVAQSQQSKMIISALSYGINNEVGAPQFPIMKVLTNQFSSFNPSSIQANVVNVGESIVKVKNQYVGEDNESRSGGQIQVEFSERADLAVTLLHKVWYEYCQEVRRGNVVPEYSFIRRKMLDFQSSMYYFVVGPDCETIVYWCKYTGIQPIMVPYDIFGKPDGSPQKTSVTYTYMYKEDMEPEALADFNLAVGMNASTVADPKSQNPRIDLANNSNLADAVFLNPQKKIKEMIANTAGRAYENTVSAYDSVTNSLKYGYEKTLEVGKGVIEDIKQIEYEKRLGEARDALTSPDAFGTYLARNFYPSSALGTNPANTNSQFALSNLSNDLRGLTPLGESQPKTDNPRNLIYGAKDVIVARKKFSGEGGSDGKEVYILQFVPLNTEEEILSNLDEYFQIAKRESTVL